MNLELAITSGEFAQTVSDLSSSDVGRQLSSSLAGLAEVEHRAHDIQNIQSEQDMVTLMATGKLTTRSVIPASSQNRVVDEYARLINSVRVRSS
jgi:sorting nexin-1/2